MKIVNDATREVELTDAEQVVKEWYTTLLDDGYSCGDAIQRIVDSVPDNSLTRECLSNDMFITHLIN